MSLQNKDLLKCGVCFEQYDDSERRPRTLPCHHFFCSSCIDKMISAVITQCPTCRVPIGVASASMLPANTLMEDLLQSLNVPQPVLNEDFSAGFCPEHSNCKMYFKCKNHKTNVCRDCTVLGHPAGVCQLISLKDEFRENIKVHQQIVMDQIGILDNAIAVVQIKKTTENETIKAMHCELKNLQNKANNKLEDIKRSETNVNNFNDVLQNTKKIQEQLHTVKSKLETENKATEMNRLCEEVRNITVESKKFQLTLIQKCTASPKPGIVYLKILLQNSSKDIFIVDDEDSVKRVSKLILRDGQLCLPLLSKDLQTTTNSSTYKMSSIKHFMTDSEIYLTLSKENKIIGTVHIQLLSNEYGKRIAGLMMGTSDCSIIEKTRNYTEYKLWTTNHNSNKSCKCNKSSVDGIVAEKPETGGVYYVNPGTIILCPPQPTLDVKHLRVGTVTRGMDVVSAACCDGVTIVETGVVL